MPPQPLSSLKKKSVRINSHPGVLRSRPELAVLVGDVIALFSHIEVNLSVVLTRMLGGRVRAGSAMYRAVHGFNVQLNVLEAVAKIEVSNEKLPLFRAVLTLVRRAARKRDKLAHWLWAISSDIDGALLLIDPDAAMDYHTGLAEHLATNPQHMDLIEAKDVPPLDLKTVFIYRKDDFQEIIDELNGVFSLTTTLIGCVTRTHFLWPKQWTLLAAAPEVIKELKAGSPAERRGQRMGRKPKLTEAQQ